MAGRIEIEIDATEFRKKLDIKDGVDGKTPIPGVDFELPKDGKDGQSIVGPKGDKGDSGESIIGPSGSPGRDGSPDTPEQVRDKLRELKAPNKLNIEDLGNVDVLESTIIAKAFVPKAITSNYDVEINNLTDGQVLKYNVTKNKWINGAVGSPSAESRVVFSVSTTTSAGSDENTDYVYLISGTTTLTLPTAVGNTNLYTVKNVGTGTVTIATTGGQTLDGSSVITMPVRYTSVDLISDNSNWNVT